MKVSVIITTFNRANLLRRAIESVLAQEYKDFELIVLDNNSKDDTENIVKKFNDSRILYVKHKPLGISEARNLGVRRARGEYVGFLDDDDKWLPSKLSLQTTLFDRSSPKLGLVYGGFLRMSSDGAVYEIFKPTLRGNVLREYLCQRNPLTGSASNPLIRRSVFSVVGGYDEGIKTSEDWEFYLRLARKYEFDFVSQPVVKIRQHKGPRLGDRIKDALDTELLVYKNFQDIIESDKACKSFYLQAIGGKYCRISQLAIGRRYIREAIHSHPLNFKAYWQYIFSFFGSSFYQRMHKFYKFFR